ncbi:hypothetical protein CCAX7_008730 [Capsulimonas corticalis]|uniref:Uncharacterized protein n=1 Tax=Capsulimonas corticalis TaxID=2219043 RepID=A0A402CU32_9BACT|nr:transglutaminase family protein [Capsulimonas corticalis]BDI28822.1 hypothetical protein CCAX7_008730 [Capsulimonas corticalis]
MKIKIHFECELQLAAAAPTILQLEAADIPGAQNIESSSLKIEPDVQTEEFLDIYKNPCRRLLMPAGDVRIEYNSVVELPDKRGAFIEPTEPDILHLPTDMLTYTLPSRYCQSDKLVKMANDTFGSITPGFARVQEICNWINENITYQYGTSNSGTSAYETAAERVGVCRDFAHLAITFCRAMNIPARYVSGYCLGLQPPDLHAFFHAYIDGRWVVFDATERQPRPALIQIAAGRDAADCAWSTFYGNGSTRSMQVDVTEIEEEE